jgi:hypothetical protein
MAFIPQNFKAQVGPAIKAIWLNALDVTANFVLGGAQTVAQALAALGLTAAALITAVPVTISQGGTGVTTLAAFLASMFPSIWQLINPQTAAEAAVPVVPTNYAYPELDPRRYGVDTTGATNSQAAMMTWFSVAAQYQGVMLKMTPAGRVRCDTGISWDTNLIGLDLQGATLDFSQMAAGHAISYVNSNANPNLRPVLNPVHALRNGHLLGPGVGVTGVTCEYISDTGANHQFGGIKVAYVTFQDFATDVTLDSGANFVCHSHCSFTLTAGVNTTYSVIATAAPNNAGERNSFMDCTWYNKLYLFDNLATVSADLNLTNCSLDYFVRALSVTGGGGSIFMYGGHMEANTDTDNWAAVVGAESSIVMTGVTLSVTGNRVNNDLFNSDSTVTNGGIFLRDCFFGTGANTFTKKLIGGTGNAGVFNLLQPAGGTKPALCAAQGLLAYPGFENALYTAEWTLGGTTPAVRSNAQAHSGTYSLSFPGAAAGNLPTALATFPCKPGQNFQGEYWYLSPAITGTGATFFLFVNFLDKGGNIIAQTEELQIVANVAAWTRAGFNSQPPAPPGTVSAQLSFGVNGIASGNATSYIDDLVVNIA